MENRIIADLITFFNTHNWLFWILFSWTVCFVIYEWLKFILNKTTPLIQGNHRILGASFLSNPFKNTSSHFHIYSTHHLQSNITSATFFPP